MVNRSGRRSPFASPNLAAFVIALIGCAVLGSCLALAQGFTATVTGTVTDTSGAVLPGTAISIKNLETGLTRAVEADPGGNYRIAAPPVGERSLRAQNSGVRRDTGAG